MSAKQKLMVVVILLFLFLNPIQRVSAEIYWITKDAEDDVSHYIDDSLQYSGNYANEIDIVSLELIESEITLTLQDPPISDFDHTYSIYIYWNNYEGDASYNRTYGSYDQYFNNIQTRLVNSTGYQIAQESLVDMFRVIGRRIIVPITIIPIMRLFQ